MTKVVAEGAEPKSNLLRAAAHESILLRSLLRAGGHGRTGLAPYRAASKAS
jgi:hypothetical protein